MKIKHFRIYLLVIVFIVLGVAVLWFKQILGSSPMAPSKNRFSSDETVAKAQPITPEPGNAAKSAPRSTSSADQKWASLVATPITFYGKAIDENKSPIPGAIVSVSVGDHPFGGNTKRDLMTDVNGLFTFIGHGLGIAVTVSKEGYYVDDSARGSFTYFNDGGIDNRHQDPSNPAIFVLRKKGRGETLIKSRKIVRFKRDGTPISLDLANGKLGLGRKTEIVVAVWTNDDDIKPNSNQTYEWGCRFTVPGGGLIKRTGVYDFVAPEEGYSATDEIDMPVSLGDKWRRNANRQYFVKFAGDYHARIEIDVIAGGDHFIIIDSYLNPTPGTLNLENESTPQ